MQRKMASTLPHDKPESSKAQDKKLDQMSSFGRGFYSCHGREDEGGISNYVVEPNTLGETPRVARAKHRMEYSTESQWAVLGEELAAEIGECKGGGMVDKVLAWRKKRGDFNYDDDDDDESEAFLGDIEVPQLPCDMTGVTENTMNLGFLKSDLQFECLLRNIPYLGSDDKPQLISRLMHYKETLFLDANTFDILQGQCITSTCRDDEGGILNDAVKSDALGSEYLPHSSSDSQGADLGQEFMRAKIGESGGAGLSMVDAWRKKTGDFHYDDDDDDEDEEDYDDEGEDDDDDEQKAFHGDEVPQTTKACGAS